MKEIKEMTLEELDKESGELWSYLHITRETGTYDSFNYNGLDYWDADRRYHKISQEIILQYVLECKK